MSEPEVMLWSRLRGRGPDKPTFRRQHPFGSVILDFYCPSARMVVEVDGRTHWEEVDREHDAARDGWLERQGVITVRIEASEIYRDLNSVVDGILLRAEELKSAACWRLARSTTRSSAGLSPASAGGPPPAATRGR